MDIGQGLARELAFRERERALMKQAEKRMGELKAAGHGWEEAWRTDPIAVAYRALLKEVWAS